MEECGSRNMEGAEEKANEQRPRKRLCLNTSPCKELRLNANKKRSNKLQISLNNYFLTKEVVAVFKPVTELPQEIVQEILMRVTYKSHYKLMSVCKSWNAMVDNHKFYQDRMRFGRSEELICLIENLDGKAYRTPGQWEAAPSRSARYHKPGQVVTVYDPLQDKCDAAPSFPIGYRFDSRDSRCVSTNHKLIFMGLYKQDTDMLTKVVLIYDFSSSLWKQGSDMPVFHSSFACAVSPHDGLIYIAGGSYGCKNAMCYNAEKDQWEILPEMQENMIKCQGFFKNDKFYVIGHCNCDIEIFDTHTRVWTTLKDMWISRWFPDHCVAAFGCLYYFEDEVMEYDWKENVWRQIDHFPSMWVYVSHGGTIWKDKIFVIGYETESCKEKYYMFQPSKSGTLISERWTAIERPIDIHDHVMVAVNLKV